MSIQSSNLVESAMKQICSIYDLLNSDLIHEVIGKLREISTRSNALDIKHNISKEGKSKDNKNADNSI